MKKSHSENNCGLNTDLSPFGLENFQSDNILYESSKTLKIEGMPTVYAKYM